MVAVVSVVVIYLRGFDLLAQSLLLPHFLVDEGC
jgi:hypothetical protein